MPAYKATSTFSLGDIDGNEHNDLAQQSVTCSASQLVLLQHLVYVPGPIQRLENGHHCEYSLRLLPIHTPFPLFHLAFVFVSLCKA